MSCTPVTEMTHYFAVVVLRCPLFPLCPFKDGQKPKLSFKGPSVSSILLLCSSQVLPFSVRKATFETLLETVSALHNLSTKNLLNTSNFKIFFTLTMKYLNRQYLQKTF